jgi:hypothetical protein
VAFFFDGEGYFSDSYFSSPVDSVFSSPLGPDLSASPGSSDMRFCLGGEEAAYSSTNSVFSGGYCFFELI